METNKTGINVDLDKFKILSENLNVAGDLIVEILDKSVGIRVKVISDGQFEVKFLTFMGPMIGVYINYYDNITTIICSDFNNDDDANMAVKAIRWAIENK